MAWTVVQSGHAASDTGNSYTATAGANFTAGNLVVVMSTWGTATPTDLTSYKIGTTSAVLKNVTTDATDSQSFVMGYFLNCPGGTNILNINGVAGNMHDCLVLWAELTNTGVSGATFDTSAARVQVLGAAGSATLGTNIGASGDVIVGFIIEDSNTGSLTPGAGWSSEVNDASDPSFFNLSASLIAQLGATGAAQPTWTTGASGSFLIGGMSFTIAAGGSETLSGADTISAFTSVGSVVAGRLLQASDTIAAFISAGSLVTGEVLSGADTIAPFLSSGSAVAGRIVSAADLIGPFLSVGTLVDASQPAVVGNLWPWIRRRRRF